MMNKVMATKAKRPRVLKLKPFYVAQARNGLLVPDDDHPEQEGWFVHFTSGETSAHNENWLQSMARLHGYQLHVRKLRAEEYDDVDW